MRRIGAKSPVDDLALGRGVVLSRAATTLRSIETQPLDQEICPAPLAAAAGRFPCPFTSHQFLFGLVFFLVCRLLTVGLDGWVPVTVSGCEPSSPAVVSPVSFRNGSKREGSEIAMYVWMEYLIILRIACDWALILLFPCVCGLNT